MEESTFCTLHTIIIHHTIISISTTGKNPHASSPTRLGSEGGELLQLEVRDKAEQMPSSGHIHRHAAR